MSVSDLYRKREARIALLQALFGVAVVVGFLLLFWFAGREAREGRPGQHWVCAKTDQVVIDKFNGMETECVEGYWAPN